MRCAALGPNGWAARFTGDGEDDVPTAWFARSNGTIGRISSRLHLYGQL